jgi:hypothetical protein
MGVILPDWKLTFRNLIFRTRVTSGEAGGQGKQKKSVGCHSSWLKAYLQKPDFQDQGDLWRGRRSGKAVGDLLTEGLPPEPDFEDQGDLWEARGQAKQKKTDGCLSPILGLTSGACFWPLASASATL